MWAKQWRASAVGQGFWSRAYVGKHLSHGRLHHPLAIVCVRTVGISGDVVVVDAASVFSNPILGVFVFVKFRLVHLGTGRAS